MASYIPPTENLAIFDPSVFDVDDEPLTLETANSLFLRYPVAQGAETIAQLTSVDIATNDLQSNSINTTTLTANDLVTDTATVTNTLECDTIEATDTAAILSIGGTTVSGNIFLGTNSTRTSTLNIGTGTSPSGAVNINTGSNSTSTTNISTGVLSTGKTINIGAISSGNCITNLGGSAVTLGGSNCGAFQIRSLAATGTIQLGHTLTGGSVSIGATDTTNTTTTFNIAAGTNQSGTISIATGSTSTSLVNIGRGNVIQINNVAPAITLSRPLGLSTISPNFNTHLGFVPTAVFYTIPSAIGAPTFRHTIATPVLTLGVGMYAITYWIQITIGTLMSGLTYNHGIMTSVPTTGDSSTASSVTNFNTIGDGCDYVFPYSGLTTQTGFIALSHNGVILNNYSGTYNSLYAIFNFDFVSGSISSGGGIFMRATRVG